MCVLILGISRDRLLAGFEAARGAEPARMRTTAWASREATYAASGLGAFTDLSVTDFTAALADDAATITPKGAGPVFTMGSSTRGGSSDAECSARFGLTLDLDERPVRSDGTLGIEPVIEALRAAGIAFVLQVRNAKCHVHIPFAEP